jgi:hypothetical protein
MKDNLYRFEVYSQAKIFNIAGKNPEEARMKLIDNEDISIDDEVSEGELIE